LVIVVTYLVFVNVLKENRDKHNGFEEVEGKSWGLSPLPAVPSPSQSQACTVPQICHSDLVVNFSAVWIPPSWSMTPACVCCELGSLSLPRYLITNNELMSSCSVCRSSQIPPPEVKEREKVQEAIGAPTPLWTKKN
jgi:hypothetical protein